MVPGNRNSLMLSPSGEQVAIFIDGKWRLFIAADILAMDAERAEAVATNATEEAAFHVEMTLKYVGTDKCPACRGEGWEAGHVCADDEECQQMCPQQIQCNVCGGTGKFSEPVDARYNDDDDLPF